MKPVQPEFTCIRWTATGRFLDELLHPMDDEDNGAVKQESTSNGREKEDRTPTADPWAEEGRDARATAEPWREEGRRPRTRRASHARHRTAAWLFSRRRPIAAEMQSTRRTWRI